jgi:hypothetical protein
MNRFLQLIFAVAIGALLVPAVSAPSDAEARGLFDGDWSVVINTLRGDCDRSLRYSLRIVDNHVVAGEQSYQAAGRVEANGQIYVVVAEGGRSARGAGRLFGNNGRGQWRTSTGQCAGIWTAVRRSSF